MVHDSHDPGACEQLADAYKNLSTLRQAENQQLVAEGKAPKPMLCLRDIVTVLQ